MTKDLRAVQTEGETRLDLALVDGLDAPAHDVTSDEKGADGRPIFHSRLGGLGEVVPVEGTDQLQSGKSYGFFCSIHPGMRGTLVVGP